MNHRCAQINGVPAYAHTFSLFLILFPISLFCAAFLCTCLLYYLFHKSAAKNKIQLKSIKKKISSVYYRFSALN
jgi:hypothetical protein